MQFAGIYYVDDGGQPECGVRLVDPRQQSSMIPVPARWTYGMGEHIRVRSLPGLFVLFPAWLQHYVVGHDGEQPRISVSFNVRVTFPDETRSEVGVRRIASDQHELDAGAPLDLSFIVPNHHQAAFLDATLAGDMLVK